MRGSSKSILLFSVLFLNVACEISVIESDKESVSTTGTTGLKVAHSLLGSWTAKNATTYRDLIEKGFTDNVEDRAERVEFRMEDFSQDSQQYSQLEQISGELREFLETVFNNPDALYESMELHFTADKLTMKTHCYLPNGEVSATVEVSSQILIEEDKLHILENAQNIQRYKLFGYDQDCKSDLEKEVLDYKIKGAQLSVYVGDEVYEFVR